jgi:hypothetical protein
VSTDVSGEHIAFIFRVKNVLSRWFLAQIIFFGLKIEAIYSSKRRLTFNGLHGFISQKIMLFIRFLVMTSIDIVLGRCTL